MFDSLDDEELMARCRADQQGAWGTLVRRYQRLIFTIPLRAGLSEDAAADVFQTAFARLFENLHRIADASRVRAWLVTTAKRETLLLIEQSRRLAELPQAHEGSDDEDPLHAIEDPAPLAEEALAELQEHDRLRQAVDRLDPRSRQFIELLFLQEEPLPYSEIAARLGIAEGSIGPTRSRCLDKLRRLLAEL